MSDTAAGSTSLLNEARRLVDEATERGLVLRMLGGLAIGVLTPALPPRTRTGQDLDFGSMSSSRRGLSDLLTEQGYEPDKTFNALYGSKQLSFANPQTGLAVDVLIGSATA
ncbi:MAG TPA: hypothetical protein VMU39_10205 [Solirubrobacteraceae bacterium]|nr:hypothetical protein [Solirubrobacteraceae bacterium]